ncbi:MAG: hypothetical protein ACYC6Y_22445 [Thermoguttaceae bacterium]
MCVEAKGNVLSDHRNFYDWQTMTELACGLVLGGAMANTSMDQNLRDWYQDDVRTDDTDDFAGFWNNLGVGHIFIPSYACLALACKLLDNGPIFEVTGEFSGRVTRAYLVGAPPVLFMQFALGASRPDEADHGSYWDPFDDMNSLSGHAFIGAVPFITAAHMTDSVALRSGLYACSTLTGLARFNNDDHYLSQVILGWWMAYLACEAVDQTEFNRHGMTLMPIASAEMVGVQGIFEY